MSNKNKVFLANLSDLKLEQWFRHRNARQIAWRTKDKNVIPIKDMTDEHLERTISMIERNERKNWEYYEALGSCDRETYEL